MAHAWAFDSETETEVLFRCGVPGCALVVGFAKEGLGEPHAVGHEVPANIDVYASPCFVPRAPGDVVMSRRAFLSRFTDVELVAMLRSDDDGVVASWFRLSSNGSDIHSEDPDVIALLGRLTELGVLAGGRSEEILS